MSKVELRQDALRSRRSLTRQTIERLSAEVVRRLLGLPEFSKVKTIATYVAKDDEVQTSAVIERALSSKKRVLVPKSDPSNTALHFCEIMSLGELVPGHFGILEPPPGAREVPLSEAGVVLVPVVAWDEGGHRLGYGRGYFDRALRQRGSALAVALALESQRYPSIPQAEGDVSLDAVVTESRTLRFGRSER